MCVAFHGIFRLTQLTVEIGSRDCAFFQAMSCLLSGVARLRNCVRKLAKMKQRLTPLQVQLIMWRIPGLHQSPPVLVLHLAANMFALPLLQLCMVPRLAVEAKVGCFSYRVDTCERR